MALFAGSSAKTARNNRGLRRQQGTGQSKGDSVAEGPPKQPNAIDRSLQAGLLHAVLAIAFSEAHESSYLSMLDDVGILPWRFGQTTTLSWNIIQNELKESRLGIHEKFPSFVKLLTCVACGSIENPRFQLLVAKAWPTGLPCVAHSACAGHQYFPGATSAADGGWVPAWLPQCWGLCHTLS